MAMTYMKNWQGGLRSHVITWKNSKSKLTIVAYPMLHLASPEFYETINDAIADDAYILVEGVRSTDKASPPPLHDLAAGALGLVTQQQHFKAPENATVINVDMPEGVFRQRLRALPFWDKLFLRWIRYILWFAIHVAIGSVGGRKELLHVWGRRRDRKEKKSARDRLIINQRDRFIASNIKRFVKEHQETPKEMTVSIIFGAAHMPAISRAMRKVNYRVADKHWIDVIIPDDFFEDKPLDADEEAITSSGND